MATSPTSWVPRSRRIQQRISPEEVVLSHTESDASDWEDLTDAEQDARRKSVSLLQDLPDEFNTYLIGAVVKKEVSRDI